MAEQSGDLAQAIQSLANVKDEHRGLVSQIAGDPGMSPEVRRTLLEHLYEEEDEHVAGIQALLGQGGGAAATPSSPAAGGGLSVGSLRAERRAGGGSVGSLRSER